MTRSFDIDQVLDEWLGEGPSRLPDRVVAGIAADLEHAAPKRTRSSRQQRGWRGLLGGVHVSRLAFQFGGAVVVIVVGAIALGVYLNNPRSSVGPQPSPTPPATPTSWSRVRLDPPLAGGAAPGFGDLVAGPDRLVAVGVNGSGPATAWTSSDGATWTRTAAESLDAAQIQHISSGGPGFIATGSSVPETSRRKTIWTSADGVSWNRLPDDPAFGNALLISDIEPGGPGLVAVGYWMGAWYSSDGSTWERASVPPLPPDVYPGDGGNSPQIYLGNVADGGGRLVATGSAMLTEDENGDQPVVVWTSRDGRSWTDVPTPADVFPQGASISDVAAGPDGFVAVGAITVGQVSTPAIWYSPNGRDWRLHRPGPDGLHLYSVAAGDGGYVAVGATMECRADTNCASSEAVVMTSTDGESWVRLPSGPEFRVAQPEDPENAPGAAMIEVVAWGSRFAALGRYDGKPTVWVTTPTP